MFCYEKELQVESHLHAALALAQEDPRAPALARHVAAADDAASAAAAGNPVSAAALRSSGGRQWARAPALALGGAGAGADSDPLVRARERASAARLFYLHLALAAHGAANAGSFAALAPGSKFPSRRESTGQYSAVPSSFAYNLLAPLFSASASALFAPAPHASIQTSGPAVSAIMGAVPQWLPPFAARYRSHLPQSHHHGHAKQHSPFVAALSHALSLLSASAPLFVAWPSPPLAPLAAPSPAQYSSSASPAASESVGAADCLVGWGSGNGFGSDHASSASSSASGAGGASDSRASGPAPVRSLSAAICGTLDAVTDGLVADAHTLVFSSMTAGIKVFYCWSLCFFILFLFILFFPFDFFLVSIVSLFFPLV